LTVVTEAIGDLRSTNERRPILVGLLGYHAGIRDFYPALAALVSPVQNKNFTAHFFTLCVPIAQQPGQAVVPGRLSLNMRLWSSPFLHDSFPGPPQAL
jgi:hypothetical protein